MTPQYFSSLWLPTCCSQLWSPCSQLPTRSKLTLWLGTRAVRCWQRHQLCKGGAWRTSLSRGTIAGPTVIRSTKTTQVLLAETRLWGTRTMQRAPTWWAIAMRTRDGTPAPDGVGVLVHCKNINSCKNNHYYLLLTKSAPTPFSTFQPQHTGIAKSGSCGFYFSCIPMCTNCWHHGSKWVPRTPSSKCHTSFGFHASPSNNVVPCDAIFSPYPNWSGTFCQPGLQDCLWQDICHSLPSQWPPHPQRLAGPWRPLAVAMPSHCFSSTSSTLATFVSNLCGAIYRNVNVPASP